MTFKILVTSQKGGVGKSTLSANLVAYFSRQLQLRTTLIDWDPHGSSSNWLLHAPNVGVVVQHLSLPVDQGGNRPIFEARLQLRHATQTSDIVLCDLTWSDSLAGELMFEFDMVLVPTSVSEIELGATSGFLSRNRWVFDSAAARRPMLLVCPTRVLPEQLASNIFTKQRFPVSFMLAPPVQESQTARDLYERGFLMDSEDVCGFSFLQFAQAVCAAREMRMAQNKQATKPAVQQPHSATVSGSERFTQSTALRPSVLDNMVGSAQYSILGRHRQRKALEAEESTAGTSAPANSSSSHSPTSKSMSSLGIPEFIKRLSRNSSPAKL
jgi:cellulose biosynthesis protein BcsQ